jgi:sugar phosphate isomerase/epimerase
MPTLATPASFASGRTKPSDLAQSAFRQNEPSGRALSIRQNEPKQVASSVPKKLEAAIPLHGRPWAPVVSPTTGGTQSAGVWQNSSKVKASSIVLTLPGLTDAEPAVDNLPAGRDLASEVTRPRTCILEGNAVTPDFSLAHLTVLSLAPPEMVRVAARSGYRHVGLRLIAVTPATPGYPLMTDRAMMRETKAAMADTGVGVLDIEFVMITPEIDVAALEPFVASGAELGARYVVTAPYDPDLARLAERFGAIADLAGKFGLGAVLEFFPWTVVPDLVTAVQIVEAAGRANAGILVDTLHFDRSGSTFAQLDQVPSAWLPFAHACDAPAEKPTTNAGLIHTARAERLPPGEGGIDIPAIISHMPAGIPVALEIPMETLTREVGPEEVARRVREAAARVLANVESRR